MKQFQKAKSPRVFISHALEDMIQTKRLYYDLQRDGIDAFVDFACIKPGDPLLMRINEGLEWCDTQILLWSEHAAKSRWISVEWQTAFKLQRRIIPILLDDTELPSILSCLLYLSFGNYDEDYPKLCKALGVTSIPGNRPAST